MNITVTVNGVVVEVDIPDKPVEDKTVDTRESIPLDAVGVHEVTDAVGVHEVTDIVPVPDDVEA